MCLLQGWKYLLLGKPILQNAIFLFINMRFNGIQNLIKTHEIKRYKKLLKIPSKHLYDCFIILDSISTQIPYLLHRIHTSLRCFVLKVFVIFYHLFTTMQCEISTLSLTTLFSFFIFLDHPSQHGAFFWLSRQFFTLR